MPSKKKKYNARFPAGRIKKIMQSDEEIGKVAQAVPVIIFFAYIPRTLELFVESLLKKTLKITNARNAKTLSTSHMKQCIMSEQRFDFLRELVKNIPDISVAEDEAAQSSPEEQYPDSDTPYDLSMPSTSTQACQQRNTLPINDGAAGGTAGQGDIVNYFKRNSNSVTVGSTSVIMHTTSVETAMGNNNECLPPKLARSDSAPIQSYIPVLKPIWRPVETSPITTRKRLKHQSQSLPQPSSNNNNNNNNINTPPKQQQLDNPLFHPQPAIPPPIVNFELCTKPVIKIDYSNLSLNAQTKNCRTSASTITTAPQSAPVLGDTNDKRSVTNTAFDFSATAPIINIDLSNMMTTTSHEQAPVINGPAVATISIGALPLTSPTTATKPASTPTPIASTKTNTLFELDEDYDNI